MGRIAFDNEIIKQVITYTCLWIYFRNVNLKKHFFLLLYVAGLTQAVWSILQLGGILPSGHPILNGTGGFFNPGMLGIFLVLASLAGIALFDKKPAFGYKFLWAISFALLLCGILLSQSRAAWFALMAGCCWLFFTVREYHREKQADRLLVEAQHHPALLTDSLMIRLYNHLQGNPDFMLCYGKTLCNHGLYTIARPVLEQAYHLKPSSGLVCDLGRCYQHSKQYSEAEQSYLLAAAMTPSHIFPHYCLFLLYRETGDPAKAAEKARYMLVMPAKVVNTSVLRFRGQARQFLKEYESGTAM